MWGGPPLDDVGNQWEADPKISDLVSRLAERRTPLEEAEKAIGEFLAGTAAEKQDKARLLFAGLFDTLNRQRSDVMSAIERFTRKQKDLAAKVRAEALRLREDQNAPDSDPAKAEQAANEIAWNTRIFEDRRKTIGYVCEVPIIIERRLFALARAIAQNLD
jgi:DNA polymerase III alpha subunit